MNKNDFIKICKMTQPELKGWLSVVLPTYYGNVVVEDGYIYAKGIDPIGVTAHLDTVHKEPVRKVKENNGKISSPQGIGGDDRCGVYMILKLLTETELRPTIIFCEDEEIGGKGSQKFVRSKFINDLSNLLFIIELDRANANDLVFYEDVNDDFHAFCEEATGYKEAFGSFSDISTICPACKISGVNISCGYHGAHTLDEYVVLKEMENSIKTVITLIKKGIENGEQFEYKEDPWYSSYKYYNNYNSQKYFGSKKKQDDFTISVIFFDYDGNEYYYEGRQSVKECIADLLMDYPDLCWGMIMDYEII